MIEMELVKNKSSIDIRLHFYFEDPAVHSMNAEIFNECQHEFINALKQVNKYLPEKLEIEVAARKEGGLIDVILVIVNHPLAQAVVVAFITNFFTSRFHTKLSKKEERSMEIADIIKMREAIAAGTFTEDDFDNLAKKDKELKKRKSHFFKTAKKEKALTQIEADTSTFVADKPLFNKITVFYQQFDDFIVIDDEDETTETNKDDNARIFLIAPVLVEGVHTNWKGYYGGVPIDFKVSDKEFLKDIYSRATKFGKGTYIDCKLLTTKTIKGETGKENILREVSYVDEIGDDKNFKKPIKHKKTQWKITLKTYCFLLRISLNEVV